ncbi:hypothetical protein IWW36_000309 [Coemansia brasiliensis]|uniref:Tubulin-specific chaperone D n=1 Tax=Coemansia brasiliensis TaxID=2650707 RepID=A0A9W8IJZ2_9FUNG|nr:hypothetical protein IWW36_000309 [Coemansia brasiliensis]
MNNPTADDAEDVGNMPTFFKEHVEFFDSLRWILDSAKQSESWSLSIAPEEESDRVGKLIKIINSYQEQPMCLDPHLERIVGQIIKVVQQYVYAFYDNIVDLKSLSISVTRFDGIFDLLYMLCKVRGYKVILRFFPHGVADVEPVFATLWQFSTKLRVSAWQSRYILLIWLSLLAMIPFDIESIDSGIADLPAINSISSNQSLMVRWIELGKLFLAKPGCEMEGAAVMLSRLLSRKDSAASFQSLFIEWAVQQINDAANPVTSHPKDESKAALPIESVLQINGTLRVLCHLFSAMTSPALIEKQMPLLLDLFNLDAFDHHSITRKLISKAVQRLALLMLPVTILEKRRVHARPSLRTNLNDNGIDTVPTPICSKGPYTAADEDDSFDIDIPEEVEFFVSILLQKLRDKDTIVRWSAAKGIGRITERLPLAFAQEIVSAVGDILKEETLRTDDGHIDVSMTTEYSWHGSLLCLAELSRRGMLYPQALREIIPWVVRGLTYEIQRGDYSVGSNVRDAACYVMWSLARIPNPSSRQVFAEMSTQMATTLVSVAVFDRESSVRRAASAAFQEHVGRQSDFPHGIAVLQLVDFFSVGIMRNAFIKASRNVAEFDVYRHPLLYHLCTVTIYHWDLKTRDLAIMALRELAPLSPKYVLTSLLPEIVSNVSSPFLAIRHGAIAATGAIAESIAAEITADANATKMVLAVADNVPKRYIEDFGAGLTLAAFAFYMGCLSRAKWNIGDNVQNKFFDLFEMALVACKHVDSIVDDFTAFVDSYGLKPEQHLCIENNIKVAKSGTSRESFVLAMGALAEQRDIDILCSIVTEGATVEMRRNAAVALGQLCRRIQDSKIHDAAWAVAVVAALSQGLNDHSIDNRGDVGSWVRKQSLQSLAIIFDHDNQLAQRISTEDGALAMRLVGQVLCATTEKIDKLRAAAGRMFEILLYKQQIDLDGSAPGSVDVGKCLSQLRQLDPMQPEHFSMHESSANGDDFTWTDAEAAFRRVVPALSVSYEQTRRSLLEGLVFTGSAEPLGKFAVSAVAAYAETLSETVASEAESAAQWDVNGLVAELTRLLHTDKRTSKIINPTLIVADQLIEQGALLAADTNSSIALMSDELAQMATSSLLAYMAHPILRSQRIRQAAADHLFEVLCIHGAVDMDDDGAEIGSLLSETEWMQDTADVKEARSQLTKMIRRHVPPA